MHVIFGYLDPGTGSMLVQLLVGGVAAAGVTAKFYWRRLMRLFGIRKDDPQIAAQQNRQAGGDSDR